MCKTRGASYNRFPRNTKMKFIASCVQADRDALRIQAEMEAAYGEYEPGQVFHSEAMFEADDTRFHIDVVREARNDYGLTEPLHLRAYA